MVDRDFRIPVNRAALMYAAMFALAFAAASWFLPAAYYHLSPASDHVEINEISVDKQPDVPKTHQLEVTVNAKEKYPVEAKVTLYRHGDNGTQVGVEEWSFTGFIEPGESTQRLPLKRDQALRTGIYSYEVTATVHADYHAVKKVTAQSPTFEVVNPNATQRQTTPTTTETETPTVTLTPRATRRPTVTPSTRANRTRSPTPTRRATRSLPNGTRSPTPTPAETETRRATQTPTPQPFD